MCVLQNTTESGPLQDDIGQGMMTSQFTPSHGHIITVIHLLHLWLESTGPMVGTQGLLGLKTFKTS